MLYVTTRNRKDAFTSHHVLTKGRGEDGGLFVPLHFPKLSRQEISKLSAMSFGQCAAQMLNLFFSEKLSGWDLDFSIGRYPVRLEQLSHRVMMAETWHNPDWQYQRLEKNLLELLHAETVYPGSWVSVAVRMSVLAGLLGNLDNPDAELVDVALVTGDFTGPISAWYLRKMGFPVGNIICCCNENNQFWELICNGQMRTDGTRLSTIVPEADVVLPINLERLISDCGSCPEAERFAGCCGTGSVYTASDTMLQQMRQGLYVSVVSTTRVETTIPNVYKTHHYVLSPASALCYSGLMDYRTKTGITRTAVVLCDKSPVCDGNVVSKAMNIPAEELINLI